MTAPSPFTDHQLALVRQAVRETFRDKLSFATDDTNISNIYRPLTDIVQQEVMTALLEHNKGNQTKTAEQMNINRSTLRTMMTRHNISPKGVDHE